jgi:hypothetical protein
VFVRGRSVVVALACALLAAGCGSGGGTPRTLPPLSSRPTASPTPSADAPNELAAATAVVRQYFRLLNQLAQGTAPSDFSALETAGCNCRKFLAMLRVVRSRHRHYFGRAHLTAVRPSVNSPTEVEVLVAYNAGPSGIADSRGRTIHRFPRRTGATEVFTVVRSSQRWLISNESVLKEGD